MLLQITQTIYCIIGFVLSIIGFILVITDSDF